MKIISQPRVPDSDSFLYRYLTIDKLLDFLASGRIPLVRLDVFQDKLEGAEINHLILNQVSEKVSEYSGEFFGKLIQTVGSNINIIRKRSLRELKKEFQNSNYASCWYIHDHESVAMWQLYSDKNSVAIRIPFKNILQVLSDKTFDLSESNIENLMYGNVGYYKFNDPESFSDIYEESKGFYKDFGFKHEQEFRIKASLTNQNRDIRIVYLTFHAFTQLPFEIIFHPESSEWHTKNVSTTIEKFNLPFKAVKSSLTAFFQ